MSIAAKGQPIVECLAQLYGVRLNISVLFNARPMSSESFQPISVKSPLSSPTLFKLRCLIDLQLLTIANFLQPAMACFSHGTIIDVGAGESPWKQWLPKDCSYRGIDIRYSTEFGMSHRGDEVTLYDGGVMPFESNSFDGAICIEVLEHAEDPDLLLSEIFRIMKPGSFMLLTVPWSARRHHIPYDFHRFTKERLGILLSKNRFTNITIKERGNDYCVIANKMIVNAIRNINRLSLFNFYYKIPLIGLISAFSTVMLAVSYVSLLFGTPDSEDPLGYSCIAMKP
jgi:SAM-dependent methyltransferase